MSWSIKRTNFSMPCSLIAIQIFRARKPRDVCRLKSCSHLPDARPRDAVSRYSTRSMPGVGVRWDPISMLFPQCFGSLDEALLDQQSCLLTTLVLHPKIV